MNIESDNLVYESLRRELVNMLTVRNWKEPEAERFVELITHAAMVRTTGAVREIVGAGMAGVRHDR